MQQALIAGGVGMAALFLLPYNLRGALIISMIGIIACLSLVLLTGLVGQVSLFQFGLAGVAGVIVSKLASSHGIGWPWSPLIGILGAVILGLVTALPALRVRGVELAILTLAAAAALNSFYFGNPVFGVPAAGAPVPQPEIFGFSIGTNSPVRSLDGDQPSPLFGVGVLIVLIACAVLVANIRRGSLGKRMLAVRSNERSAAAAGISPAAIKMVTFGIATVIMALAGIMYGYNFSGLDPTRFTVFNTLALVAFRLPGRHHHGPRRCHRRADHLRRPGQLRAGSLPEHLDHHPADPGGRPARIHDHHQPGRHRPGTAAEVARPGSHGACGGHGSASSPAARAA